MSQKEDVDNFRKYYRKYQMDKLVGLCCNCDNLGVEMGQ